MQITCWWQGWIKTTHLGITVAYSQPQDYIDTIGQIHMEQLNPQILLISKAQNRIHWLTKNIFKYIQKCEMEHWSVRSTYFLGGKSNQGRKRREFRSPSAHPNPPFLSFKAETKRVPPFFFFFVLLNLGSKENHHSSQTLKTVSKVLQTQRYSNGHTGKTLREQIGPIQTARADITIKRLSGNSVISKGLRDLHEVIKLRADGQNASVSAQGIKLLESQDPSHNGWAQGSLVCAGAGQWPSHFPKIPVLQPGPASC